jgi:hypothetical protein
MPTTTLNAPEPSFVAFGNSNSWWLQWEGGAWDSSGLGDELVWELTNHKEPAKAVALGTDDNRWFIKYENGSTQWFGLSTTLSDKLKKWSASFVQFFNNDGFFVKFEDGSTYWQGIPAYLAKLAEKYTVDRLYSDGSGGWLATFSDGCWEYQGIDDSLSKQLPASLLQRDIKFITLSPVGYFASVAGNFWWQSPSRSFDTLMDPKPSALNPNDIYFTNDSIMRCFQNGANIDDTIKRLDGGIYVVEDFPPIRVVFHEQGWWSLDNRRLYCFQQVFIS